MKRYKLTYIEMNGLLEIYVDAFDVQQAINNSRGVFNLIGINLVPMVQ